MTAWGGRRVMKLRAPWQDRINRETVPCARCSLPVMPGQRWHLGHQHDRALGGGDDPGNLWPEHVRCSTSAGGKLGHMLNTRTSAPVQVKRRKWVT